MEANGRRDGGLDGDGDFERVNLEDAVAARRRRGAEEKGGLSGPPGGDGRGV